MCLYEKRQYFYRPILTKMKLNALQYFIIFIFSTSLFYVSCKKKEKINEVELACQHNQAKPIFNTSSINNLPIVNENIRVCGLFPLSVNAKWIYRDSFFDSNGVLTQVKMDTLYVQKQIKSNADNAIWWNVRSAKYKGIPSLIHSTDSTLYMLDMAYNPTVQVLKAYDWLQILPQDSVRKGNSYSDIAYLEMNKKMKNNTVTVPFGTFTNCIQNIKYLGATNEEIIFKPEIGVLKFTSYNVLGNPFVINPSHKKQVSELVGVIK